MSGLVANPTDITQFHRDKYGRELLVDAGLISTNPQFLLNDNAFVVSFFEIYLITAGEGVFHLNEQAYPFQKGTMLFLPPGMVRRWGERTPDVDAHYLIFEEEFIQRFFRDPLFIYRLHLFNPPWPASIQLAKE
ncbi:MAG: AraC family ligand binding domain-containing protein [Bacteroidota bacterium]